MADFPIIQKPRFGEACNRCGQCCAGELCPVAELLFAGSQLPCPALELHDGQFSCGVLVRPGYYITPHWNSEDRLFADQHMRGKIAEVLAIGQGCGMPDEFAEGL